MTRHFPATASRLAIACLLLAAMPVGAAADGVLKIYVDADFSNHAASSVSIERGILTALAPARGRLGKRPVEVVRKDHRGNSKRSRRHIEQYLADPDALLMMSGIHSPPLLANRDYINANEVLYLVPWAAAGPITRPAPDTVNWVFRLSVDDTRAGDLIARYAVTELGYRRPYLLLENTGWGESNHRNMTRALAELSVDVVDVGWFDWNVGPAAAGALVDRAGFANADVLFLVANTMEGEVFARESAAAHRTPIPMLSHWGITGGDFHDRVTHAQRTRIGLKFIQTRFSFLQPDLSAYQQRVLDTAIRRFAGIGSAADIAAPAGFIHAHDLTTLLAHAMRNVTASGDARSYRRAVRAALEQIDTPVEGLIKTYRRPFSPYAPDQPNAHEALGITDLAMAEFGERNEIRVLPWRYLTAP